MSEIDVLSCLIYPTLVNLQKCQQIYKDLQSEPNKFSQNRSIVLLGDLYTRVGNNLVVSNRNGKMLTAFCVQIKLGINNSYFPHKLLVLDSKKQKFPICSI